MFPLLLLVTILLSLVCANWAAKSARSTTISGLRFAFRLWSSIGAGLAGLALAAVGHFAIGGPFAFSLFPIGFAVTFAGSLLIAAFRD